MQLRVGFRTDEIPKSDNLPTITASCYLTGLDFIPLPPVNHSDITVTSREVEALFSNMYRVSISYDFTFDVPGLLQEFQVWFNESLAPRDLSNSRDIQLTRVGALERSVSVEDMVQSSNGTFNVYLQVRLNMLAITLP